jgi:hypothetical protein
MPKYLVISGLFGKRIEVPSIAHKRKPFHSNQVELDQFFKAINDEKIASQVITKSAFFQSRKQVSYNAFVALNQSLINEVGEYMNRSLNDSKRHKKRMPFPWYILLVLLYLFECQSTW